MRKSFHTLTSETVLIPWHAQQPEETGSEPRPRRKPEDDPPSDHEDNPLNLDDDREEDSKEDDEETAASDKEDVGDTFVDMRTFLGLVNEVGEMRTILMSIDSKLEGSGGNGGGGGGGDDDDGGDDKKDDDDGNDERDDYDDDNSSVGSYRDTRKVKIVKTAKEKRVIPYSTESDIGLIEKGDYLNSDNKTVIARKQNQLNFMPKDLELDLTQEGDCLRIPSTPDGT